MTTSATTLLATGAVLLGGAAVAWWHAPSQAACCVPVDVTAVAPVSVAPVSARVPVAPFPAAVRAPVSNAELFASGPGGVGRAVAWVLAQDAATRDRLVAGMMDEAMQDRDAAEKFVRELSDRDPGRAATYGAHFIHALGRIGEHRRAAEFAATAADEWAVNWLTTAYHRWAQAEPADAFASAIAVEGPERRRAAWQAVIAGWAWSAPTQLAETAALFPPGPEKQLALIAALRAWADRDGAAAAAWMRAHHDAFAGMAGLDRILEN
jgi:hypothetical protein